MKAALAAVEGPRTLIGKGHGAGPEVVRMSVWGFVLSSRTDDAFGFSSRTDNAACQKIFFIKKIQWPYRCKKQHLERRRIIVIALGIVVGLE